MESVDLFNRLAPELEETMEVRLTILQALSNHQYRIGRKVLADQIDLSERTLRTHLQVLREQALVDVSRAGIKITEEGQELTRSLQDLLEGQDRVPDLEKALCQSLDLDHAWVVKGEAERNPAVYQLLAKAAQTILAQELPQEAVVAVTGGSTLANIGQYFTPQLSQNRHLSFVPSRGGMEGSFHIQSNTVAGIMAQETQADYVPLYVPDRLTHDLSQQLLQDPAIKKALNLGKKASCLLLSVGSAQVMAQRRNLDDQQVEALQVGQAVGEAFGIFYDSQGQVVFSIPRLGLQLEDILDFPLLLTIVAGSQKAAATRAFYKMMPKKSWLICDEGLAKAVLNGVTQFK